MKAIGGGAVEQLEVTIEGKKMPLKARVGLFGLSLGVAKTPEEHAGKLIIPHWGNLQTYVREGHDPKHFQLQPTHQRYYLVQSVYHAYRQTWHILAGYGITLEQGEKKRLRETFERARQLHLAILGFEPGIDAETIQQETKVLLESISKEITHSRSLTKKQVQQKLKELSSGTDSLGRVNVPAQAARARSVMDSLRLILEGRILYIDPHIMKRQRVLINMIQEAEARLCIVRSFVEALAQQEHFETLPLSKRELIAIQCKLYAEELETVDFNPYRAMCANTAKDLRTIALHLEDETVDQIETYGYTAEIKKIIAVCLAAFKIKGIQIELERIIFRLMRIEQGSRKQFPLYETLGKVATIQHALEQFHTLPFRTVVCQPALRELKLATIALNHMKGRPINLHHVRTIRTILKKTSSYL